MITNIKFTFMIHFILALFCQSRLRLVHALSLELDSKRFAKPELQAQPTKLIKLN